MQGKIDIFELCEFCYTHCKYFSTVVIPIGQQKDLGLDHPGGGLVRAVRDTGHVIVPYLMSRRYDYGR